MQITKQQATHAVVNNAPKIINVFADDPVLVQRLFINSGPPTSSTLAAGNGKYNGASSGFIASASLVAAGTGYTAGNVLTVSGGTATTTCQITVDLVTAAGAIVDFHVSRTGVYSAYPNNAVSVTGGSGTGATFNLAVPPNDFYLDCASLTAPVHYVCMTAGTNATSVWAALGGGGGASLQQFKIVSDGGDWWVCKAWDGTTLGTNPVFVWKPAKLRAGATAIATETIRGVVQNYTYAPITVGGVVGYYVRSVTVGGNLIEKDVIIPDALANDIIDALPHPNLGQQVTAAVVHALGSGYTNNDIVTVVGGTGTAATLKLAVTAGVITGVTINSPGAYTIAPATTASVSGGTGTGATFDLTLGSALRALADGRAWSEI